MARGRGRSGRLAALALAALVVVALPAGTARAADPGRWKLSDVRHVPIQYFQGLTHAPDGSRFFAGVFQGLHRTDLGLRELASVGNALPPEVGALGFNHIGDLTWDRAEGGRLLLPLECYVPGAPNGGNTCGRGAIGVADPATLAFRYLVGLDPADIAKAMWAEVSPDGRELWTSSGDDLLAYSAAEVNAANAAAGTLIRPVRRLPGAVPPSGVTGGAFFRRRLLIPGQNGLDPLQIWSVGVNGGGPSRLEVELPVYGEAEGVDVIADGSGLLHWLITPSAPGGRPPTYGTGHSALVSFVPRARARLRLTIVPKRISALRSQSVAAIVSLRLRGKRWPVANAVVAGGGASARTNADGIARIDLPPQAAGTLHLRAFKQQLRSRQVVVRVG